MLVGGRRQLRRAPVFGPRRSDIHTYMCPDNAVGYCRRGRRSRIRGGATRYGTWPARRDLEWARRPGASPPMRMTASWFGSDRACRIQVCGAMFALDGELPSDGLTLGAGSSWTGSKTQQKPLDTKSPIQVHWHIPAVRPDPIRRQGQPRPPRWGMGRPSRQPERTAGIGARRSPGTRQAIVRSYPHRAGAGNGCRKSRAHVNLLTVVLLRSHASFPRGERATRTLAESDQSIKSGCGVKYRY
jgi:hypothetical protein